MMVEILCYRPYTLFVKTMVFLSWIWMRNILIAIGQEKRPIAPTTNIIDMIA